ncbi:hypothetical protein BDR07DRAFT_1412593 [Suillus spraguei]|nr:hypothetical protein BDR07DRAFT_1412593 [Suillus spraguei]
MQWCWSAITTTRLYAMYQESRKILIFLAVTSVAISIFTGILAVMMTIYISGEELILSGTYQCSFSILSSAEYISLLIPIGWILMTAWEVLALCLAVWIAVKHFLELRQCSPGGIVVDCFAVLIKTHMLYFASFVATSSFTVFIGLSPTNSADPLSLQNQIYYGLLQIFSAVQPSVLGSRLILGVREYNASLVANSDTATDMTSIAFQERVHISTGSSV